MAETLTAAEIGDPEKLRAVVLEMAEKLSTITKEQDAAVKKKSTTKERATKPAEDARPSDTTIRDAVRKNPHY